MSRIGDRGEMEAFVRSIELGSFSAAARQLGLTPSGVSKLVTRLEKALKAKLVNRTTRSVGLTPEGELFAARCRRILAEMQDAETEVGRSRDKPRGKLRMHVGVGFAIHQVVPVLPRFLARHPEVELDLALDDRRVDLAREGFDISVRPWPLETDTLVVRKLFDFERVICASPAYLKRHGRPKSPDELLRHRCLCVTSIPGNAEWKFAAPGGDRIIRVAPAIAANNADCVYRFAVAGEGVARLNEFIVAQAIARGQLVPLLGDFKVAEKVPMLAIYPQERHRLPRVAAMLDFLADAFGDRPWRKK